MALIEVTLLPIGPEHFDGAVQLSRQAGWPHRPEDWRLVLSLSEGVAAVGDDGAVVGTILMTPYGDDCATINMVIVDERMRGRGLGRRLMDAAMRLAEPRPLRLVATTDGFPLYQKLGFRQTGVIAQHQGVANWVEATDGVDEAGPADIAAIVDLDAEAFGARREELIARLAEIGDLAVIRREGRIAAFGVIRDFGRGEVIGPLVATELDDAISILSHFMSQRTGRFLRVDTGAESGLADWLVGHGLVHVGGGIAMACPPIERADKATKTFALANQALG